MSEFQIGQKASVKAVMSDEAVREFARISGDNNPLHLSDAYAEGTRFGKRIAHGILVSGQISRVIGTILPGEGTVYLSQSLHFKRPVYVGDTVTAEVEIAAMDNEKQRMKLTTTVLNEAGECVLSGEAIVIPPVHGES